MWIDDITFRAPGRAPRFPRRRWRRIALAVDAAGNGVLQPNETAVVAPTWRNTGASPIALTGRAHQLHRARPGRRTPSPTPPPPTARSRVAGNASCSTGGDCYSVQRDREPVRPRTGTARSLETVNPTATTKTWTLHIGDSFTDVPASNAFYRFIETILHKSVTGGCTHDHLLPDRRPRPASRWRSSCSCPRRPPATTRRPACAAPNVHRRSGDQPLLPLGRRAGPPRRRHRLRRRQLYCPTSPGHP